MEEIFAFTLCRIFFISIIHKAYMCQIVSNSTFGVGFTYWPVSAQYANGQQVVVNCSHGHQFDPESIPDTTVWSINMHVKIKCLSNGQWDFYPRCRAPTRKNPDDPEKPKASDTFYYIGIVAGMLTIVGIVGSGIFVLFYIVKKFTQPEVTPLTSGPKGDEQKEIVKHAAPVSMDNAVTRTTVTRFQQEPEPETVNDTTVHDAVSGWWT